MPHRAGLKIAGVHHEAGSPVTQPQTNNRCDMWVPFVQRIGRWRWRHQAKIRRIRWAYSQAPGDDFLPGGSRRIHNFYDNACMVNHCTLALYYDQYEDFQFFDLQTGAAFELCLERPCDSIDRGADLFHAGLGFLATAENRKRSSQSACCTL